MSLPAPIGQDDDALTELLGEKCPDCGYRRGTHRAGAGTLIVPCPSGGAG